MKLALTHKQIALPQETLHSLSKLYRSRTKILRSAKKLCIRSQNFKHLQKHYCKLISLQFSNFNFVGHVTCRNQCHLSLTMSMIYGIQYTKNIYIYTVYIFFKSIVVYFVFVFHLHNEIQQGPIVFKNTVFVFHRRKSFT